MKKYMFGLMLGLCLSSHAQINNGNHWFYGLGYGYPLGVSLDLGRFHPPAKVDRCTKEWGNFCLGKHWVAEVGTSGGCFGMGYALVMGQGFGFLSTGADISYMVTQNWGDWNLWTPREMHLVGADLAISVVGVRLRTGPYWAVDPDHRGDFVFRTSLGAGF